MPGNMTMSEFVSTVSETTGLEKTQVKNVIETVFGPGRGPAQEVRRVQDPVYRKDGDEEDPGQEAPSGGLQKSLHWSVGV